MFRVGIIGSSFGGSAHLPAFLKSEKVKVYGICSGHIENANKIAKAFAIEKVYSRWIDLVTDPKIDIVSIAVPPNLQGEIVASAIENSKHLFCEKPLGCGTRVALSLMESALRKGILHAVDFEFLEMPLWQRAQDLIGQGRLGKIQHVLVNWHICTFAYQHNIDSWKKKVGLGGGALNQFGSHVLFYLERFFGSIGALRADLKFAGSGESEPLVHLTLEFMSGFCALVTISINSPFGSGHRLEIYGSEGKLILDNPTTDHFGGFTLTLQDIRSGLAEQFSPAVEDLKLDQRVAAVSRLVDRFLDGLIQKSLIEPNLEHGVRVEYLIEQARQSQEQGCWVRCDSLLSGGGRIIE